MSLMDILTEDFSSDIFSLKKNDLHHLGVNCLHPTGSKYICNPPVMTTDEDYYAYAPNTDNALIKLKADGWELCTENEYDEDTFTALRKGSYNLILLFTSEDYFTHVQTTELAKRFNLTNKQDRIDLFELVRNGSYQ